MHPFGVLFRCGSPRRDVHRTCSRLLRRILSALQEKSRGIQPTLALNCVPPRGSEGQRDGQVAFKPASAPSLKEDPWSLWVRKTTPIWPGVAELRGVYRRVSEFPIERRRFQKQHTNGRRYPCRGSLRGTSTDIQTPELSSMRGHIFQVPDAAE